MARPAGLEEPACHCAALRPWPESSPVEIPSSWPSARAVLLKNKFRNKEVPLPSFWGGYRVVPDQIEFWQGRRNRLHDRFQYSLQDDGSWSIERLAP